MERGVSLFGSPSNKNSRKLGKNNRDQFSINQWEKKSNHKTDNGK